MKITYLFGAGASRNALPIVTEIPDRIEKMIEYISDERFILSQTERFQDSNLEGNKDDIRNWLIGDLRWLLLEASNHASVDTFAKKLYIKRDYHSLNRLKAAFSSYLVLEQTKNKADKRYDSFFASLLLGHLDTLPKNVRILNWNYDIQFEKAFSEFTSSKDFRLSQDFLNTYTKFTYRIPKNDKFSLIKLNGSTNLNHTSYGREKNFINEFCDEISLTFLESVLNHYAILKSDIPGNYSGLSFAWERHSKKEQDIIEHAKSETSDTEVLIVIGYSFPYFNREIDREIIANMQNLKKVYFQAPDAEILKERFLTIRDDELNFKIRHDVGQFLLSNEL